MLPYVRSLKESQPKEDQKVFKLPRYKWHKRKFGFISNFSCLYDIDISRRDYSMIMDSPWLKIDFLRINAAEKFV